MLTKIRYQSNFPKNLILPYFRDWNLPENSLLYFNNDLIYGKINHQKIHYFIIKNNQIYYLKSKIRVPVIFNKLIFYKDLESFDQNDFFIKNQLRNQVLNLLDNKKNNLKLDLVGIGGEYYLYFPFLTYQNYYGFTNHQSIFDDADFNAKLFQIKIKNNLIDYQTFNFKLQKKANILINLFKVNQSVFNFINQNLPLIDTLVIIACQEVKLNKINRKIKNIYHFIGNSLLRIYLF